MAEDVTSGQSLKKGPGPDPVRGIQGFVLYLSGYICFGTFLVWAYIPPTWLHSLELTYWPQRYWAVAVPVYATCLGVISLVLTASYNLLMVEPLDSIHCVQDDVKILPDVVEDDSPRPSIPKIRDIPINVYCRQAYDLHTTEFT